MLVFPKGLSDLCLPDSLDGADAVLSLPGIHLPHRPLSIHHRALVCFFKHYVSKANFMATGKPWEHLFFLFPCCTVFHEHLTQTCCDRHKFRTWNRQLPTCGLVTLQIMTNYLTPLWSMLSQGTLLDWKTPEGFPSCVANTVWLLQHPKTQPLFTLTVRWHLLFLDCLHFFYYILDFWAMYVVKFVTSITSIYPILHIVTYQKNNPFCEFSILRPINVFCF